MIFAVHKRTKEHRISQPGTMWDGDSWYLVPADDDGWIEHDGKECPLPEGLKHEVKFRSGTVSKMGCPDVWRWGHRSDRADIIAYRPILDTKPKEPAWDGDSWPPTEGARVEVRHRGSEEFLPGTVAAVGKQGSDDRIAVKTDRGDLLTYKGKRGMKGRMVRPIRSEEDRVVDDALDAIGAEKGDRGYVEGVVLRMIRAGYRKVEDK